LDIDADISMPRYFLKPVVWNSNDYQHPSGARFTSGYPKETGFGHEEWNNNSENIIGEGGVSYRVFYTQPLGNFPATRYSGDIFLFMIASNGGHQYLIGVAGDCSYIENLSDRRALKRHIRWRQAWAVPSVRQKFGLDQSAFLERWRAEEGWCPNWKCPNSMFLWLNRPHILNPSEISGRQRLIGMYRSYQEIDASVAVKLLSLVPESDQPLVAARLREPIGCAEFEMKTDLKDLRTNSDLDETTRAALIQARIGQGKFRSDLEVFWSGMCSVTGCTIRQVLRASHIKRWRDSSNRERLDACNGLLLVATLDALFEHGLISFNDSGNMLLSENLGRLSSAEKRELGLGKPLRVAPRARTRRYLEHHRKYHGFDA
jgi:hypothetical protein